jgi:hypothetical protein
MCSICSDTQEAKLNAPTRRDMLKSLMALGLTMPLAMAALDNAANAKPMSFMDRNEFLEGLKNLIETANSSELVEYRIFELKNTDMPWRKIDLELAKDQQVTFLLGGRVWLSREHDIWLEPGTMFNARSEGKRPFYCPMNNTGTMIAAHGGPIEIARALAEWKSEAGDLWTPEDAYKQIDVKMYGIALVWRGDAAAGLKSIAAHGDVGGMLGSEISRLESGRKLPEGWHHFYMAESGAVIFNDIGDGQISCHAYKNGGILQRPVSMDLKPGVKLGWRWIVEELPSLQPEDQIITHDYLSVGAEFDDGQDLTYLWSTGLPVGKVFRCPFPRWNPIETHMVIRSGTGELGSWLSEERDLYEDYKTHIGGPAKSVKRIWLLGIALFQRRLGACRFADIQLNAPGADPLKL